MLVELGDAVVPRWDGREERERPAVTSTENEIVYVGNTVSVRKMDGPILDASYGRMLLDQGMAEGFIPEVAVCGMSYDDSMNRRLGCASEVEGDIGGGDRSSYNYNTLEMHTY